MFAPILAICEFRVVRTPEKSLSPLRRQRAIRRVSERSRLVVATVDDDSDNECEVVEESDGGPRKHDRPLLPARGEI